MSDKIEGIARDEREARAAAISQNTYVLWFDNQHSVDNIDVVGMRKRDLHHISDFDVLQRSKESVAMSRNPDVVIVSESTSPDNSSQSAIESKVVGTVVHWRSDLQSRN